MLKLKSRAVRPVLKTVATRLKYQNVVRLGFSRCVTAQPVLRMGFTTCVCYVMARARPGVRCSRREKSSAELGSGPGLAWPGFCLAKYNTVSDRGDPTTTLTTLSRIKLWALALDYTTLLKYQHQFSSGLYIIIIPIN